MVGSSHGAIKFSGGVSTTICVLSAQPALETAHKIRVIKISRHAINDCSFFLCIFICLPFRALGYGLRLGIGIAYNIDSACVCLQPVDKLALTTYSQAEGYAAYQGGGRGAATYPQGLAGDVHHNPLM
ncbi:hypothetical protein DW219_00055 [Desulfovibrio sp. AM18-2]|nr:hypothetical protein DW219_00055 [Desulfovibrio sp. AM18-2]